MYQKLITVALLLLAGCSETQEKSQSQVAQGQQNGQEYLYINAQKPGVKVMPSGLQFEIIESGEGRSPLVTSRV
jgi:FKBP-type peptidyl-prolyl cis-trans isomerase FklB